MVYKYLNKVFKEGEGEVNENKLYSANAIYNYGGGCGRLVVLLST